MLFLIPIPALVNQVFPQSAENSAPTIRTTPNVADADSDLRDCSQMLDQSLEETRSCKDLVVKQKNELLAVYGEKAVGEKIIKYYEAMEKKFSDRIDYLEKIKCSELKVLWIFRWRYC